MGEQQRCATCKWWGRSYGDYVPGSDFGVGPGFGRCGAIVKDSDAKGAIAFTHDPYETPMLLTSADFGCTLWQGKD